MRRCIFRTKKNLTSTKVKTEMSNFALYIQDIFYFYPQGDQQAKKHLIFIG